MLLSLMYGKLHRVHITHTDLHYEGSAGFDRQLLDAAGLMVGQKVDIVNITNGERFSTYLLAEPAGSGKAAIYGAAARKTAVGDIVIVIAYAHMTPAEAATFCPKVVQVQAGNTLLGA